MTASPSQQRPPLPLPPPPQQERSEGGKGTVSLFLDTDLGTRFGMLVAYDSTMHHLKSEVAAEHAAVFPEIGPVAVKSFQVQRKGVLYHLSDLMTLRSAFAKVSAGYFLHVKMTGAVTVTHSCRDAPSMKDRGKSIEGCPGVEVNVEKGVNKLPASVSETATDLHPQGVEGYEDATMLKNLANEEKSARENNAHQNEPVERARKKRLMDDGGRHEEGVVETSKMEKSSKSKNISEKIQPTDHTSQDKCKKAKKKAKKASSIDMASVDIAGEKDQCGYGENAAKTDRSATQSEIVNDPLDQRISSNKKPEDSNVIENPHGERRQDKRKRPHSKSSKIADPIHDVTKPSGFIRNEISIENTNATPLDPKQIIPATVREGTVSDQKNFDESLDVAAANVIDDVLADLRSKDHVSKDLDEHLLAEQTNQGSYQDVLGLHGNTGDKGVLSAALPPKYPAAIHSDSPISSPSHNKTKEKQLKVLPTTHGSSRFSGGVPEESANSELREFVSLRYSDNGSDILTENVLVQDDGKNKDSKHQRKNISLKHAPTANAKANHPLDGQVNQVAMEDLKTANASKADLGQGGSVIDTPASTVENVQQKSRRSSKTRTPKVQQTNHSKHGEDSNSTKGSEDKYVSYIGDGGTHNNETAVGDSTQSPAVQEEAPTLRTSTPNAPKGRMKSSKTELQSQNSALDRGSDVDLMNYRAECITVSPKTSADAIEPNERINFLDHFSPSATNDPCVSADNKESNKKETVRVVEYKRNKRKTDMQSHHADNVEPNDLLETRVGVSSDLAENINRADGNVKKVKEKNKRKSNLLKSVPQQANPSGDQGIVNGIQALSFSVAKEESMKQDRKEDSSHVIQRNSMLTQDPKDATCDSTLGKKIKRSKIDIDSQSNSPIDKDHAHREKEQESTSQTKPQDPKDATSDRILGKKPKRSKIDSDSQSNFSIDKDHAHAEKEQKSTSQAKPQDLKDATSDRTIGKKLNRSNIDSDSQSNFSIDKDHVHMEKEQKMMPTSQTKPHSERVNYDESINGRTDPHSKSVRNLVKSFTMSPPASGDSMLCTPQNVRHRVAVRKVPIKRYEQTNDESKKGKGTGAIFNDAISEGSDDELGTLSEKAAIETLSDDSSTSDDSGISAAAYGRNSMPDGDGNVSLSQKSLKEGIHIGSILRGSSSYKKAKQNQTDLFDDTEVPDSQPVDDL